MPFSIFFKLLSHIFTLSSFLYSLLVPFLKFSSGFFLRFIASFYLNHDDFFIIFKFSSHIVPPFQFFNSFYSLSNRIVLIFVCSLLPWSGLLLSFFLMLNFFRFFSRLPRAQAQCKKPAKFQTAVSICQFLCPGMTLYLTLAHKVLHPGADAALAGCQHAHVGTTGTSQVCA